MYILFNSGIFLEDLIIVAIIRLRRYTMTMTMKNITRMMKRGSIIKKNVASRINKMPMKI